MTNCARQLSRLLENILLMLLVICLVLPPAGMTPRAYADPSYDSSLTTYLSEPPETTTDELEQVGELEGLTDEDVANEVAKAIEEGPTAHYTQLTYRRRLFTNWMLLGRRQMLADEIQGILKKAFHKGDPLGMKLSVMSSWAPNAWVDGRELGLTLGLLEFVRDESELAGVMYHETTHANKKILEETISEARLTYTIDLAKQTKEVSYVTDSQREEIRADMGAVLKLVLAGYNPWGLFRLFTRLDQISRQRLDALSKNAVVDSFLSTHPTYDLRKAVMKVFIAELIRNPPEGVKMADALKAEVPLSPNLHKIRSQLKLAKRLKLAGKSWAWYSSVDFLSAASLSKLLFDHDVIYKTLETVPLLTELYQVVFTAAHQVEQNFGITTEPVYSWIGSLFTSEKGTQAVHSVNSAPIDWDLALWSVAAATVTASLLWRLAKPYVVKTQQAKLIKAFKKRNRQFLENPVHSGMERQKFVQAIRGAYHHLKETSSATKRQERAHIKAMEYLTQLVVQLVLGDSGDGNFEWMGDLPAYFLQKQEVMTLLTEIWDKQGTTNPGLENLLRYREKERKTDSGVIGWQTIHWLENKKSFNQPGLPKINAIQYLVYLVQASQEISDLPIETRLELVKELIAMNLEMAAVRVFVQSPKEVFDYALSEYATKAPELLAIAGKSYLFRRDPELRHLRSEWHRAIDQWYRENRQKNPATNIPTNDIGYVGNDDNTFGFFKSPLSRLLNKDREAIRKQLSEKTKDILQMQTLAKGYQRRGIRSVGYTFRFHEAIVKNPAKFLPTTEEIDRLLSAEELWPALSKPAGLNSWSDLGDIAMSMFHQAAGTREKVYSPVHILQYHKVIIQRLKELGEYPQTFEGRLQLWKKLSFFGGSHISDALFRELDGEDDENRLESHYEEALKARRFLDPAFISKLAWFSIMKSKDMKNVHKVHLKATRKKALKRVLHSINSYMPFRGPYYIDVLEKLSWHIHSSKQEARMIDRLQREELKGGQKQGLATRFFSGASKYIVGLKTKQQWEFVRFLRHETQTFKPLDEKMQDLGSETFRGLFDNLPRTVKVGIVDQILSNKNGMLPLKGDVIDVKSANFKKIVNHVLRHTDANTRKTVTQVLEAFIAGLNGAGMGPFGTYVVANILVTDPNKKMSAGEILAETLKYVGALGIKIGQIILAANLLPEEEARHLENLTENVAAPSRNTMYEDMYSELGDRLQSYELRKLLGAASTKYVVEALKKISGDTVALKVLKTEALNSADIQFEIVGSMAKFLTDRDRMKFLKFNVVSKTATRSVKRQLEPALEVERTRVARELVYLPLWDGDNVQVPREVLLSKRVIESEFIEGRSLFEVAKAAPELASDAAANIVQREAFNLFRVDGVKMADGSTRIVFDPDRHRGNTRIKLRSKPGDRGDPVYYLEDSEAHIDMGELLDMSLAQRVEIIQLFALAQIVAQGGAVSWVTEKLKSLFPQMTDTREAEVRNLLKQFFPDQQAQPEDTYFTLLSILDEAGFDVQIVHVDFIRAIFQTQQYEKLLTGERDWMTPKEYLQAHVRYEIERLKPQITVTLGERINYVRRTGRLTAPDGPSVPVNESSPFVGQPPDCRALMENL